MYSIAITFLKELILSKKRGLWLTVLAITLLGSSSFHYVVAAPEAKTALTHAIDSVESKRKADNTAILNELKAISKEVERTNKSLDEIKKDLNQTNQNVLDFYKKKK